MIGMASSAAGSAVVLPHREREVVARSLVLSWSHLYQSTLIRKGESMLVLVMSDCPEQTVPLSNRTETRSIAPAAHRCSRIHPASVVSTADSFPQAGQVSGLPAQNVPNRMQSPKP